MDAYKILVGDLFVTLLFGTPRTLNNKNFFILFFKLVISNQNYIRFYKLICCDSA
jgi:hypothetical protein